VFTVLRGATSCIAAPRAVASGGTAATSSAAEAVVRATISRVSEFVELAWSADIELSPELAQRIWQVAGIAPLNSLDQYALLRSRTTSELLARVVEGTQGADVLFTAGWGSDPQDDGDLPE